MINVWWGNLNLQLGTSWGLVFVTINYIIGTVWSLQRVERVGWSLLIQWGLSRPRLRLRPRILWELTDFLTLLRNTIIELELDCYSTENTKDARDINTLEPDHRYLQITTRKKASLFRLFLASACKEPACFACERPCDPLWPLQHGLGRKLHPVLRSRNCICILGAQ